MFRIVTTEIPLNQGNLLLGRRKLDYLAIKENTYEFREIILVLQPGFVLEGHIFQTPGAGVHRPCHLKIAGAQNVTPLIHGLGCNLGEHFLL
jgi:hypothetical protein